MYNSLVMKIKLIYYYHFIWLFLFLAILVRMTLLMLKHIVILFNWTFFAKFNTEFVKFESRTVASWLDDFNNCIKKYVPRAMEEKRKTTIRNLRNEEWIKNPLFYFFWYIPHCQFSIWDFYRLASRVQVSLKVCKDWQWMIAWSAVQK